MATSLVSGDPFFLCVLVMFPKTHGLFLENQGSRSKGNRVFEDGDKKEGFETIL